MLRFIGESLMTLMILDLKKVDLEGYYSIFPSQILCFTTHGEELSSKNLLSYFFIQLVLAVVYFLIVVSISILFCLLKYFCPICSNE